MTEDLISRQAAIDAVKAIKFGLWEIDIPSPSVPEYREHHEQVTELMGVCDCWIKKLTEYQSVQQKVGHWIFTEHMMYCSECAEGFDTLYLNGYHYCPECGARLEGKEENEQDG